jgi:predicted enzyme related to lactoylglutathione lyase
VSGEWVLDRQPTGDAGVLVFVRVDEVEATLQKIVEAGGRDHRAAHAAGRGHRVRDFRDPAGNVLGIFQEGS